MLKGFGRKWLYPNQGVILTFSWRDFRKSQRTSVRAAGALLEILTATPVHWVTFYVIYNLAVSGLLKNEHHRTFSSYRVLRFVSSAQGRSVYIISAFTVDAFS
jgi:hypothetical protein